MTPIEIARELVIASALGLVASRTYIDSTAPGAFDDAELELGSDMLDRALRAWAKEVLAGPNPGWLLNQEVG